MSSNCHLFCEGDLLGRFRARVLTIVISTLTADRRTLSLRADIYVAGARCVLATNSAEVLQIAANGRPQQHHIGDASFEMEVVVDAARDEAAECGTFFRGMKHLVFAFLPPRSFVTYDLLRRRVHAELSVRAATDPCFWKTLLLPITIGVLGTTVGVVPLHCACLERRGSGLLIGGKAGAGKSTLTAALGRIGYTLLSDDWTYISKRESELLAHGLSTPVKLLTDSARFFPELAILPAKMALNGELAYQVNAEFLGCRGAEISSPRWIFFLERTPTPGCQLIRCRSEYARNFFEGGAERLPDELPEAKSTRAAVIRALSARPAWIIRTGETPQATAQALDAFLSEDSR
jgi:hypothetical protein